MSYFSALTQNVILSSVNSSEVNLSGSGTPIKFCFTGSAYSTLGVAAIQVSLKTDQNCTVYVQQSPDGVNWDLEDAYDYYYTLGGNGWTIQAINSYFRVLVKNLSTSPTTYFRLQSVVTPIMEAVPRSLDSYGDFKTSVRSIVGLFDTRVGVSPTNDLRTAETTKLVGVQFMGDVLDSNFWVTTSNGSATVTQAAGRLNMATGVTAGSSCSLQSVRSGRYNVGTTNYFSGVSRFEPHTGSCIQRWGAFNTSSGYYFEVSNSIFSVGWRNSGSDSKISNGALVGTLGSSYTFDNTAKTWGIYYTTYTTWWVVDEIVIHHEAGTLAPLSDTQTLPIRYELINQSANISNNQIHSRELSLARLGKLTTNPITGRITTPGTYLFKRGAGFLHRIIFGSPVTGSITLYDNITDTGATLSVISLKDNMVPLTMEMGIPFYTGLTAGSTSSQDITLVYE